MRKRETDSIMERDPTRNLETLVSRLRDFGLAENEAKVYSSLLLKSPLRPSEASEMSGVARAEVHRHLRSLEKRGFCLVVAGESKRYAAVPPEFALTPIIQQERKRRETMKKTRDQLAPELENLQHLTAAQNGVGRFQVLRDAQIALERGAKMMSEAKSIARVILHEATIQSYITTGILKNLESPTTSKNDEVKPQAEIRILLVESPSTDGTLKDILSRINLASRCKSKWSSSPMMQTLPDVIISDDKQLFLHIAPPSVGKVGNMKEEAKAVLSDISSMVKPFTLMFDQDWSKATDC
jgi:sugar-specific transcriptional regulator TrmB